MNLERTKLSTVGHLDFLWHQVINRNIRHIDENLIGQGVRLPARSDVTQGMIVSFVGGEVIPGCFGGDFIGVVVSIVNNHAFVVIAGNAAVALTTAVEVGDFVYARDDGRGEVLTQIEAIALGKQHTRIVGVCVESGSSSCVVAVKARGWRGALAAVPAVAAEGVICCASSPASKKPYLLSSVVTTSNGAAVVDYAFESATNKSSISVTDNRMRFTFTHPYSGLPSVRITHGFNKRCVVNLYITPAFVTAKLFAATGAAMSFSSVVGDVHMVAKGAAA